MSDLISNYKKNIKKNQNEQRNKLINKLKIKIWFIKNKWNIFIFSIVFCVLFFPENTASLIANWINKFIGTLFNSINF